MKKTESVARSVNDISSRSHSAYFANLFRSGFLSRLRRFSEGKLTIIEGDQQWTFGDTRAKLSASIIVSNRRFYRLIALSSSLGAAEGYIRGYWSTNNLVNLVRILLRNQHVFTPVERAATRALRPMRRLYHRMRDNTLKGSKRNILAHYDLSNELYKLFLDPTMTYSCGIFERADSTLEEASIEKLDRICRKLNLSPGDQVLEIGSGWGSFAIHAARNYGCHITTTSISDCQYDYIVELVKKSGLTDRITVLKKDYRELTGAFDRLVSIEMIEAVGVKHIPVFIEKCSQLLKPDGVMALQAITIADQRFDDYRRSVDFIQAMVFPGASLISISHLMKNLRLKSDMRPIDLEDITPHYATTLARWRRSFMSKRDAVRDLGFGEEFIRLWEYYLAYCEGGFREAYIGDVQLLLAKPKYRAGLKRGDG